MSRPTYRGLVLAGFLLASGFIGFVDGTAEKFSAIGFLLLTMSGLIALEDVWALRNPSKAEVRALSWAGRAALAGFVALPVIVAAGLVLVSLVGLSDGLIPLSVLLIVLAMTSTGVAIEMKYVFKAGSEIPITKRGSKMLVLTLFVAGSLIQYIVLVL